MSVCFLLSGCLFDRATSPSAAATGAGSDTVPLGRVVAEVKKAVDEYQNSPEGADAYLPRLNTAEFTFNVIRTASGDLGVNVFLFKIGGSHSREASHSVTYTYQVPPPERSLLASRSRPPPRKDSLVEAIKQAAAAAKTSTQFGELPLTEMAIEIEFVVKWEGNVGVSAPISLVTVGAEISGSKSTTQSVRLVFGKAK